MSGLSPRQMFLLDEACKPIRAAFGEIPYLVGTAVDGKDFRDVDVRLMLPDWEYDALRSAVGRDVITFLGFAIGEYLAARTGMPIDFQLQRLTEANARHSGSRNPLGARGLDHYEGDAAPDDAQQARRLRGEGE